MVASFGTNSTLNEQKMNYEILILHDFKSQEFYGSELTLEIFGLIRPESKFDNFDVFIRAMECDVSIAKKMIKLVANL
jgi:FAD synthase